MDLATSFRLQRLQTSQWKQEVTVSSVTSDPQRLTHYSASRSDNLPYHGPYEKLHMKPSAIKSTREHLPYLLYLNAVRRASLKV